MKLGETPPLHLTYCLNVHAGESWAENLDVLRTTVLRVRDVVATGIPFGLGLRLSHQASVALLEGDAMLDLTNVLSNNNLYVFTINGFPYGAFHGTRVKEAVYHPDWRAGERLDYTCRLADIMARLLPAGVNGSISTVPGSYRDWIRTDGDVSRMVDNLSDTVAHLADVEARTGRYVHLGLEPEPDCYLETTADVLSFFDRLDDEAVPRLAALRNCPTETAHVLLHRHLGVCFDTCHLALQFEDLTDSLNRLASAGILISKMQVSAALRTRCDTETRSQLASFDDPVYLHQVKARTADDNSVLSLGDLPDALAAAEDGSHDGEAWRVHCHVPLYFEGEGRLHSTADQLTPAFFRTARQATEHFEMETYTFNVLPEALRQRGIERSLADEYAWLLPRMPVMSL